MSKYHILPPHTALNYINQKNIHQTKRKENLKNASSFNPTRNGDKAPTYPYERSVFPTSNARENTTYKTSTHESGGVLLLGAFDFRNMLEREKKGDLI